MKIVPKLKTSGFLINSGLSNNKFILYDIKIDNTDYLYITHKSRVPFRLPPKNLYKNSNKPVLLEFRDYFSSKTVEGEIKNYITIRKIYYNLGLNLKKNHRNKVVLKSRENVIAYVLLFENDYLLYKVLTNPCLSKVNNILYIDKYIKHEISINKKNRSHKRT